MRIATMTLMAVGAVALAACGGGGKAGGANAGGSAAQAPSEVAGVWGADCANPFVRFEGGQIEVYPDKQTYSLKGANLAGGALTVSYDGAAGVVTETYMLEGDTLRLDKGSYGGTEAVWHKAQMKKCR